MVRCHMMWSAICWHWMQCSSTKDVLRCKINSLDTFVSILRISYFLYISLRVLKITPLSSKTLRRRVLILSRRASFAMMLCAKLVCKANWKAAASSANQRRSCVGRNLRKIVLRQQDTNNTIIFSRTAILRFAVLIIRTASQHGESGWPGSAWREHADFSKRREAAMVPYIATFLKKIFVGGICHQLSKPVLDKVLYVVIVASRIGTYPQWGMGAL